MNRSKKIAAAATGVISAGSVSSSKKNPDDDIPLTKEYECLRYFLNMLL
jgi:hypothetical protein